jgi:hypothetical protein
MPEPRPETSFPLVLAVVNAAGYLISILSPAMAYPRLTSHVAFPDGRSYSHLWLIAPTCLAVLMSTFFIARRLPRYRTLLVSAPLIFFVIGSNQVIFGQFLPPIDLVQVASVWAVLVVFWTWTRDSRVTLEATKLTAVEIPTALEFLKEKANFYRSLAFGLVAAEAALLITGLLALHSLDKEYVELPADAFLLDQFNFSDVAMLSLLLAFGPTLESLRAWHAATDRFLELRPQAALAIIATKESPPTTPSQSPS